MRLLFLDQFSEPGGAQQMLIEFLPAVEARGWRALVGLPGDGELFRRALAMGVETERIRCGPYTSGRKSPWDVARFLVDTPVLAHHVETLAARFSADLVYVNGPRLLPAVALAGLHIPVIFHAHSYLFPGPSRRLAGMALGHCDAWLIAGCRFVAEAFCARVKPGRVRVIYNGVAGPNRERFTEHRDFDPRRPVVGCIGRIAPEKGQREFVAAAAIIRRAVAGCRFVVYGAPLFADAAVRRYAAEVRAAGEQNGVEFPGWAADVYSAMRTLDLLLVPSAGHEATTRVILEAQAAGLPMIALHSGGIPEILDHGRDGWLVYSAAEMARLAIELLRGDPARMAAVAEAAGESWRTKFTLEGFHRQLLETMEQVASES